MDDRGDPPGDGVVSLGGRVNVFGIGARLVFLTFASGLLVGCSSQGAGVGTPSSSVANVLDAVEASTTVDAQTRSKCDEATQAPPPGSELAATLRTTFAETRDAMEQRYGEEVVSRFVMPFEPADAVTLCAYATDGTSGDATTAFVVLALLDSGGSFFATVGQ